MKMKEEERMSMEMALKTEIFIWDLNQLKGPTWARCLFWGWVFYLSPDVLVPTFLPLPSAFIQFDSTYPRYTAVVF